MWQQQEPNKSGRQLMRSWEVGVPEESGARTVRARVGSVSVAGARSQRRLGDITTADVKAELGLSRREGLYLQNKQLSGGTVTITPHDNLP